MYLNARHRQNSSVGVTSTYDVNQQGAYWPSETFSGTALTLNSSEMYDTTSPRNLLGDPRFDIGGPMTLESRNLVQVQYATIDEYVEKWIVIGGSKWIKGDFLPGVIFRTDSSSGSLLGGTMSEAALTAKGTTAISRTIPTNPSFGFSRAIGELKKDGIPAIVGTSLLKEKSKFLQHSGNEFLNVEFGWAPLISDLRGFARAVKNANRTIENYRKGSDVKIKRRYNFPGESTVYTEAGAYNMWPLTPYDRTGVPWYGDRTVESHDETWFSGAFRYHLPLADDFSSKMLLWESEANKLLGSRLTPKLVYDLAPWSWALGWFSNMGDVLNNVSRLGTDGLVLQYGYVMNGRKTTTHKTASIWSQWGFDRYYQSSSTEVYKYLRRRQSTWFGFDFDVKLLTPAQDAIVVALGLSHGLR